MEVFPALSACSLFAGLTQDEIAAILPCLSARQAGFRRGQFLLRAGDEVRFAGVVLAGVLCKTDGRVLYLETHAVFSPCEKGCAQHRTLSQNLIRVLAEKNMQLNEKAGYLSQRSTREKLLAYLSAQARRAGSASFRIPFDRQQLADFLSVNRSAMSAELSKMQREGLLRAERSDFTLFQPE